MQYKSELFSLLDDFWSLYKNMLFEQLFVIYFV